MFAKCLEYLKKTATDVVNERHLRSEKDNPNTEVMYKPEQIQWVITIPAIWRISAKEFMRKAAYKVTDTFHSCFCSIKLDLKLMLETSMHPFSNVPYDSKGKTVYKKKIKMYKLTIPTQLTNYRFI